MEGFKLQSVMERLSSEASSDEERRDIYREELFDWTDNYSENLAASPDSESALEARKAIVNLWHTFAGAELAAIDGDGGPAAAIAVYEEAACDPVAGPEMGTYEQYAERLISDRGLQEAAAKDDSFQHVFLHGLSDSTLPAVVETDKLWKVYLAAFNAVRGEKLEVDMSGLYIHARELFKGTKFSEAEAVLTLPPSLGPLGDESGSGGAGADEKRAVDPTSDEADDSDTAAATQHSVEEENEQEQEQEQEQDEEVPLADLDSCEGFTPELVVKRYHQCPLLLMEPLASAASMSSLPPLRPEDRRELEEFLGVGVGDASMPQQCQWLLDLLEALWVAQALKEKDYAQWFLDLQEQHNAECIRSKERISRDGTTSMAALSAHKKRLETKLTVQRELLTAVVNKSLMGLLEEQCRVLTLVCFPGFSQGLWERLEAYVLNHQLGTVPAQPDVSLKEEMTKLQQMLGALLQRSGRLHAHTALIKVKKTTRFSDNLEMPASNSRPPVPAAAAMVAPPPPLKAAPVPAPAPAPLAVRSKRKLQEEAAPAPEPKKAAKTQVKAEAARVSQVQQVELDGVAAKAMATAAAPSTSTRRSARKR